MTPSTTRRTTTVLELQSNTPLFYTVRLNKTTGQKAYVNPLCNRAPVMYVNTVSTGEWKDGFHDDGITCLELHFWRPREEESTSTDSPDFTVDVAVPSSWTDQMYLRAMDVSIKNIKGISILPANLLCPGYNTVNHVQCLLDIPHDDVALKEMMCGLIPRCVEEVDATAALVE